MILSSLIEPTTLTVTSAFLRVVLGHHLLELAQLARAPADPDRQLRVGRSCASRRPRSSPLDSDRAAGEHETCESDDDRRYASHRDLLLGRSLPILQRVGMVRKLYEQRL